MVRPSDEEGRIDPERFKAFASVVCRNIETTYKQYKWKFEIGDYYFKAKNEIERGGVNY